MRLFKQMTPSVLGTVIFGLTVMAIKLNSGPAMPSLGVVAALAVARIAGTLLNLHFYLQGGVLLAWWFVLVVQARHLVAIWSNGSSSH